MNARTTPASALPTIPGTPFEDGFYAGRIHNTAIILPPKALAEHEPVIWNKSMERIDGAQSFYDGQSNTEAMARGGSKLAQWALDHGNYLPSLDELELLYRAFKPGTVPNDCWARSGINLNALPPTHPYTPEFPAQTTIECFCSGGTEAFEETGYWSSTQCAAVSGCAWGQWFGSGTQGVWPKSDALRARAVRRLIIE